MKCNAGVLIIGFSTPHVCHTVHEEGDVEHNTESCIEINPERVENVFVPQIVRHQNWESDCYQSEEKYEVSFLPHHYRISFQIAHVNSFAFSHYLRVWGDE